MKKNMPLVSVIVPVYNAELYLPETMNSILRQSYVNMEVICVDDGSVDGSLSILEGFAQSDSRIRIITGSNRGAGIARNRGIDEASGKYICFVDGDDVLEPGLLEGAVAAAEEGSADIVLYDSDRFGEAVDYAALTLHTLHAELLPEALMKPGNKISKPFSAADIPRDILNVTSPNVWNKLFRRDFLIRNNLKNQDIPYGEDVYFSCMALCVAERIVCVDRVWYHWRQQASGNLSSTLSENRVAVVHAFEDLYEDLNRRGIYQIVQVSFVRRCLAAMAYELGRIGRDPLKFRFYEEFREKRFQDMNLLDQPEEFYSAPQVRRIIREALLPVITVIIPVWITGTSLRGCVESVISQSWPQLEVLLVDDGSPENRAELCDDLALLDRRIQVLHTEHRGAGSARNAGLEEAHGEFVYFLDCDDRIPGGLLESLLKILENNPAGAVFWNSPEEKQNERGESSETEPAVEETPENLYRYDRDKLLRLLITEPDRASRMRNILFRAVIWDGIRFPEDETAKDSLSGDILVSWQVYSRLEEMLETVIPVEWGEEGLPEARAEKNYSPLWNRCRYLPAVMLRYEDFSLACPEYQRLLYLDVTGRIRRFISDYRESPEETRENYTTRLAGIFRPAVERLVKKPSFEEISEFRQIRWFTENPEVFRAATEFESMRLTPLLEKRENELASKEKSIEWLKGRVDILTKDKEWLAGQVESSKKERERLQGRVDTLEKNREWLTGQVESSKKERERLQGRVDTLEKNREWLTGRVENLKKDREWLTGQKERLEAKNRAAEQKISVLEDNKAWLEKKNESLRGWAEELTAENKGLRESPDYRLGRAILWLPRGIKDLFRKIFGK